MRTQMFFVAVEHELKTISGDDYWYRLVIKGTDYGNGIYKNNVYLRLLT